MSCLKFCVGERAEHPYYIKKLHIRLYSMEELCYYICENVSLLDEEVLGKELIEWIDEACKMPVLAKQLYEILHFDGSVHSFASAVLTAVSFCSPEEIRILEKRIATYEQMDLVKRKKAQADHIFLSGRYGLALGFYTELMEALLQKRKENAVEEAVFYQEMTPLLHNLATTCARMFYFDAAAELYEQAYSYLKEEKELKYILLCKKFTLSEELYESFLTTRPEYEALDEEVGKLFLKFHAQWQATVQKESIEQLIQQRELGHREEYLEKLQEQINQWKKKYQFYVMY